MTEILLLSHMYKSHLSLPLPCKCVMQTWQRRRCHFFLGLKGCPEISWGDLSRYFLQLALSRCLLQLGEPCCNMLREIKGRNIKSSL